MPALSQLLAADAAGEDGNTMTMDMTVAVGGILKQGAAAAASAIPEPHDDGDTTSMDMTAAIGGILPSSSSSSTAPPPPPPPTENDKWTLDDDEDNDTNMSGMDMTATIGDGILNKANHRDTLIPTNAPPRRSSIASMDAQAMLANARMSIASGPVNTPAASSVAHTPGLDSVRSAGSKASSRKSIAPGSMGPPSQGPSRDHLPLDGSRTRRKT